MGKLGVDLNGDGDFCAHLTGEMGDHLPANNITLFASLYAQRARINCNEGDVKKSKPLVLTY